MTGHHKSLNNDKGESVALLGLNTDWQAQSLNFKAEHVYSLVKKTVLTFLDNEFFCFLYNLNSEVWKL